MHLPLQVHTNNCSQLPTMRTMLIVAIVLSALRTKLNVHKIEIKEVRGKLQDLSISCMQH